MYVPCSVVESGAHYIASYHMYNQPEFGSAFLKKGQQQSVFGLLLRPEGALPRKGRGINALGTMGPQFCCCFLMCPLTGMDAALSSAAGELDETDVADKSKGKDVTQLMATELIDRNMLQAKLAGNTTVLCQECDVTKPLLAVAHCTECKLKVCLLHQEIHAYSKSMMHHTFETVKKRVWDSSHIKAEKILNWGAGDPMPLLIPREPVLLKVRDRHHNVVDEIDPKAPHFWSTIHSLVAKDPDSFVYTPCPNRLGLNLLAAVGGDASDDSCGAPQLIYAWPDGVAHTYRCLYCKQGFAVDAFEDDET